MIFFLLYIDPYIQIRPLPTEKILSCEFTISYFLHFLQQSARQHWKCMGTIFIWDRRLNKNQKRISTQSTWQLNMILNIGSARFLFWEKEKGFRNISSNVMTIIWLNRLAMNSKQGFGGHQHIAEQPSWTAVFPYDFKNLERIEWWRYGWIQKFS